MIQGARYVHTNLIARDWRALSAFYESLFGCVVVPPERNLSGPALEAGTGVPGATLCGVHLRLPGWGAAAQVVAITDSRVSPIRKSETESLFTLNRSASFFHSILAVLALIQGLIAILTDLERAEAGIKLVLSEKNVTNDELTASARDGKKTVVSYARCGAGICRKQL